MTMSVCLVAFALLNSPVYSRASGRCRHAEEAIVCSLGNNLVGEDGRDDNAGAHEGCAEGDGGSGESSRLHFACFGGDIM